MSGLRSFHLRCFSSSIDPQADIVTTTTCTSESSSQTKFRDHQDTLCPVHVVHLITLLVRFSSSLSEQSTLQVVIDCPAELSAILHPSFDTRLALATSLFSSVAWSTIDAILVSSPAGAMALPLITEYTEFSGRVYCTEPVLYFAQLALLEMATESAELGSMSSVLRGVRVARLKGMFGISDPPPNDREHTILSIPGNERGDLLLRAVYSVRDVESCLGKVQALRMGERVVGIFHVSFPSAHLNFSRISLVNLTLLQYAAVIVLVVVVGYSRRHFKNWRTLGNLVYTPATSSPWILSLLPVRMQLFWAIAT